VADTPASEPHAHGAADVRAAVNIRSLREAKGMSQGELARQMSARGWPYYPQTVHRIEHGQRKIGFGEAAEIAAILGTSIDRLAWAGPEADAVEALDSAALHVRRHAYAIRSEIDALLGARHHARAMLKAIRYESPRVEEARVLVRDVLERLRLDEVVRRAVEEYEETIGHPADQDAD
jgi:transcriptional regulator with XRE-family HTH domain